jgi:glycosyltransferase involved in cell wall biosynthesis
MDQLKEFVKEMGIQENVLFLGSLSIEDTRNEMLSSDVIIGTSLISNINRSIQEAMACAKPVVIFFHNNKGILTHKENCLISKPGDIEGFVDNLKLLYQNEKFREFLGLNARNTIIQQRSWDFRLKQELEVYQKIISRINK